MPTHCVAKPRILFSKMQNFAFTCIELHLPCICPSNKFVKVILHCFSVVTIRDNPPHFSIISKFADEAVDDVDYLVKVIYEDDKLSRTEDRTLRDPRVHRGPF